MRVPGLLCGPLAPPHQEGPEETETPLQMKASFFRRATGQEQVIKLVRTVGTWTPGSAGQAEDALKDDDVAPFAGHRWRSG